MATYNKQNTKTSVVPPNFYRQCSVRITKAGYKRSNGGNPMLEWKLEIVDPLEVEQDGVAYNLDSSTFTKYIVLKSEKMDNVGTMVNVVHPRLGLPEEINIPENAAEDTDPEKCPNTDQYEGIVFLVTLRSKAKIAQNKLSNGQYEAIIDPNTRKPMILSNEFDFNLEDIYGLSTVSMNEPH